MALVLLIAAMLLVLGHLMRASRLAQGALLAILFAAVLIIQLTLPMENPLRQATGGSLAGWLIVGGAAALVWAYYLVLERLKKRVPEPVAAVDDGQFSETELERYARHIVLREIGGAGQQRLKAARVLVVGAGGLGSPVLLYLAAAGVGTIGVVDDDAVSLSNLQRQIAHDEDRLGMPKVFSAQKAVGTVNPHVRVLPFHRRLTGDIAAKLVADFDLVLDGSDNFATRQIVNQACVTARTPLISGAISQWEGQISLFDPASGGPCYACVFPNAPADGVVPSCAEAGVVGALPGVIGSMMALEAIKHISRAGAGLGGEMLIYDGLYGDARKLKLSRRADCAVCGSQGD